MLETHRQATETGVSARERILDDSYELFSRAAQRGKSMASLLIEQHR